MESQSLVFGPLMPELGIGQPIKRDCRRRDVFGELCQLLSMSNTRGNGFPLKGLPEEIEQPQWLLSFIGELEFAKAEVVFH